MLKINKSLFILVIIFGVFANAAAEKVNFKIKIDQSAAPLGLSGRLLIFMTRETQTLEKIEPDFTNPAAVFISGSEVSNFDSNKIIEINPDLAAFPKAFSEAPAGDYQIMALLDTNHSYTYNGAGEGDVLSNVIRVKMPAAEIELTLSKVVPAKKPSVPANMKVVEFESPLLSAFWGRPIKMEAAVLLPPSYNESKNQKYPTSYIIHGYGGTHLSALNRGAKMTEQMKDGKLPEMIYVFLNGNCPLGHHVFADSANNGPWGTALTNDFIPSLEKEFRMDAKPSGRFLTGHSSGGWSSLWVMISHPDFFGGTWSTSPDPVDFRNFTGPDLTKTPPQNAYLDANGKDYNLVRFGDKEVMTVKQYAQQEFVLGYFGGQFASFNAVFSPKGVDGKPMPVFDTETGRIDSAVAKAWEKYDISKMLQTNWKNLSPKLKGKLHIWVGTADTFHLNEAVQLLDTELKKLGSDAKIVYLDGRSHFDMYKDGLAEKMAFEMYQIAGRKSKAAAKQVN
jgi:S-formylglutathione hydrolase FrmB